MLCRQGVIRPILRAGATAEKPAAGHRLHDGTRPRGARAPSGPRSAGRSPCALPGCACAAGDPETYAMRFDRTSTATVGRASREARMVMKTSPPTDAPAVPTAGVLHPTRDIHARVRRCNVHVKRQKSRVERLPIRPVRPPALKRGRRRTSRLTLSARHVAAAAAGSAAFTISVPLGRVAQWESARFTRERSQVRNPPRPLERPASGVILSGVPVPIGAKTPPSAKAFSRARSSSENRIACA
jgi:hypothetical protein